VSESGEKSGVARPRSPPAAAIPLFLIAPLVRGFWKIPLPLFTASWICQVLGDIIEGKPLEFLKRLAVPVGRTSLVAPGCYAAREKSFPYR
jgi:hypothetical protein